MQGHALGATCHRHVHGLADELPAKVGRAFKELPTIEVPKELFEVMEDNCKRSLEAEHHQVL